MSTLGHGDNWPRISLARSQRGLDHCKVITPSVTLFYLYKQSDGSRTWVLRVYDISGIRVGDLVSYYNILFFSMRTSN